MPSKIQIAYEKSFVAFIDVLGFTNIVNNQTSDGVKKLNKYFNVISEEISKLKQIYAKKKIGYITISDSIILTLPEASNRNENINNLRQLCIAVGKIQKSLAIADIWVRGAIAFGDTYFDPEHNQIVGPAYIAAYNLEGTLAKYPRVIIDNKIITHLEFENAKQLIMEINGYNSSFNYQGYNDWGSSVLFHWEQRNGNTNIVLQDIPLFIDYLCPINEGDEDDLITIIDNIAKNIYYDTKQYEKYHWVANYLKTIFLPSSIPLSRNKRKDAENKLNSL